MYMDCGAINFASECYIFPIYEGLVWSKFIEIYLDKSSLSKGNW